MKITCLGTGSPEPHIRRASSGYLVEVGNDKILLDCGGGVVTRLIESGRLPSDITHLFFSHLHSDHMMDYARLVHCAWDEGSKPLLVHGPKPIAKITEKLLQKTSQSTQDDPKSAQERPRAPQERPGGQNEPKSSPKL